MLLSPGHGTVWKYYIEISSAQAQVRGANLPNTNNTISQTQKTPKEIDLNKVLFLLALRVAYILLYNSF